jgi:hypothetical protein
MDPYVCLSCGRAFVRRAGDFSPNPNVCDACLLLEDDDGELTAEELLFRAQPELAGHSAPSNLHSGDSDHEA